MEDKTIKGEGKKSLTEQCVEFCNLIQKAGYKAGVYANLNWFKNYIDASKLNCSIWVAQYNNKCTYTGKYDIWQYSSSEKISGISGNVDVNYLYNESIMKETGQKNSKKSNEEIASEVIAGKWGNGNERKSKLEKAGYNPTTIQNIVNQKLSEEVNTNKKSNEIIANEVIKGLWGNGQERKNRLSKAGYNYEAIQKIVNQKLK